MNKTIIILAANFIAMNIAFSQPQGAAINTSGNPADPSAILDVNSTANPAQGMLIPRLAAAQRATITAPAQSLIIYNTDTKCLEFYISGIWQTIACGCASSPSSPAPGNNISAQTQIIWNWNTVAGATGYKWATTTDYNYATDNGTSTGITRANLTCNTAYTLYVWAYNACGSSAHTALTQTTSACFSCPANIVIDHIAGNGVPVAKTVNYGVIKSNLSGSSKCWLTQNLGADNQASSETDATEASAGWYWQFNRKQGYKHDGTTRTPNTAWITSISENSDWLAANDPCAIALGSGWRIPTYAEWNNADANGNWTTYTSSFSSELKVHPAGYLLNSSGAIGGRGNIGLYWSSTQGSDLNGWYLYLSSINCTMGGNPKPQGFTLRCLKD